MVVYPVYKEELDAEEYPWQQLHSIYSTEDKAIAAVKKITDGYRDGCVVYPPTRGATYEAITVDDFKEGE